VKGLRARSDSDRLEQKGILKDRNIADTLQATANQLEKKRNKDNLKAALGKASTAQELQDKGIIYNQNMASSLQPNANMLELELKKLQQFNKSSVVQTKILQKVSRQQKARIDELQGIIQKKDKQVALMKDISNKQTALIHNLHDEKDDNDYDGQDNDDDVMDSDIKRCLGVLVNLNNEIQNFEVNYNILKVDEIGEMDIEELVNPNSLFNNKLDKYAEIVNAINVCSSNFKQSLVELKQYMNRKYIPNTANYKNWDISEIILWIKSLENGRFIKYIDILTNGFNESEIINGEDLPDLTTADLSVTPFNIKIFRDKRDLIKNFKSLRDNNLTKDHRDVAFDEDGAKFSINMGGYSTKQTSPMPRLRLHGQSTNRVINSLIKRGNIQNDIAAMIDSIDMDPVHNEVSVADDGKKVEIKDKDDELPTTKVEKVNTSEQYVD